MEDSLSLREIAFRRCDKEPTECITDDDVAWELNSLVDAAKAVDLIVWYKDECNTAPYSSFIVSRENSHEVFVNREDYVHYYVNVFEPSINEFLRGHCSSDKDEKKLIELWESKKEDPFSFWGGPFLFEARPDDFFKHSDDYTSISWQGEGYILTNRQAKVVKILHKEYLNGTPDVGENYILEQLGTPDSDLKDTFKKSPLWQTLIISKKKGTYRLNI